jgi:hypothetical protein
MGIADGDNMGGGFAGINSSTPIKRIAEYRPVSPAQAKTR